jgi:hypothetical protein
MRDLANNISIVTALNAALSADSTSSAIDLKGFDSACVAISVGVGGITFSSSNKIEFLLTHSSDDSTYTAVTAADVRLLTNADASVGTGGIVRSLVAAHAAPTVAKVSYIGDKRYLKVMADFSGTHGAATPICVNVIKGHPASAPAA